MTQLSKLTSKIILVFLSSAYLMSCTGGTANSSFGSSSNNGASGGPPGSSDGVVDPSYFFVGVDSTVNDVAHVHLDGQFGSTCSIDPSTSLNDLVCIVDAPEAEVFMHGLALKYNVPPGMCRYLRRQTYWFYNHPVGYGPGSITVNQTFTDGTFSAGSCSINGGATSLAACTSDLEVSIDPSDQPPTIGCVYDRSLGGGVNGCLGSYGLTVNTTTIVTTGTPSNVTSTSSSVPSWGGTVASLIGGAGRWGWPQSTAGYPVTLITPAHNGLFNEIYSVPAPIDSIGAGTTMEISNYSTPAMNTHDGFVSATVSNLPYAIEPIDDYSGSAIDSGNDSYLFECRDHADEMLQRVRVYVREWDTYQDYYNYVTSKGTDEVPDRRVGNEGGTCTGIAGPCNDYLDLDDFVDRFVSYTTNLPADVNRRFGYFPQIPIK